MGNINPVEAGKDVSKYAIDKGSETVEKVINGVKYTIEKTVDTTGNIITNVYRGGILVFTDTERNIIKTLNNTQTLVSNMYTKTEEDVVYGIRSPLEKTLHIIDNHLDQVEQILNNAIIEAFDMGNLILWGCLLTILIFFLLFGKDVIIKIIDLIKSFNLSFK